MSSPVANPNGSAVTSASVAAAAVLPSQRAASAAENAAVSAEHAIAPARTPHSLWPSNVPAQISQATSGG